MSGTLRVVTIGAAGVVVAGLMASPVSAAASSRGPTAYANVSHAPRVPAGAHAIGATSTRKQISGSVALAPRDPAALRKAALAVSDPRSTSFHHYLAKGQFAAAYGPSEATVSALEATLRSAHLTVTGVSANHLLVHFSGTVGSAESAFRTRLANYRLASGRVGTETTSAPSLPASIASQVVSVVGLDTLLAPSSQLEHGSHPATTKPVTHAIPHYTGAPDACRAATDYAKDFGGLTDDQIAHAYGVDGLYKAGDLGAGETIAIYELEPFSTADAAAFDKCYYKAGAAAMASRLTVTPIDGGAGTGEGEGESILDVDDVSGIAPGANIDVYEAPLTNAGALDEYNSMVQADTAQVISTSWGFCETDANATLPGYLNVENDVFEQAALQGQTVFAAAGDSGADDCVEGADPGAQRLSTDDPSSQPFVTGVGGTTITNASNPPAEHVWNDGGDGGGGGGGVSATWGAQSWQQPFLDTAAAAAAAASGQLTPCQQSSNGALCRETPDVSAQADEYTGAITVYAAEFGGWTTFGGTSSSTPLWAAMLADIDASAGCQATGDVGFASPSLYAVAAVPADYMASFNDVTEGNNDIYDTSDGAAFAAHTGYDMASGLGTPKLTGPGDSAGLASYLCALSAPTAARPTVTSVSPATVSDNPTDPVTITGSGFTGATALSIGAFAVPTSDWSVTGPTEITVTTVPTAAEAGTAGLGPQDGSGRAIVSVTGAGGNSSVVDPAATLLYVDGTAASPVPSVAGVSAPGGAQAGGNTVTVYGSGFKASGPDAVTTVKVGGVDATAVNVINPETLTIDVPAYHSGTTNCKSGDDPVNDVCQAQVVVSNANGSSATAPILPPYTGAPFEGISDGTPLPSCVTSDECELSAAASEYDYFPTPTITSITTTSAGDPTVWASEQGTTIATIDGRGFDSLGYDWINVGSAALAANEDFEAVNLTPTEIQVVINPHNPSTEPLVKPLTVQTLGGLSATTPISYAGVPKVTGVNTPYVPDTGGGHIVISGKGFQGISPADGGELSYFYADEDLSTDQHSGYVAQDDTTVAADTPANNPGSFIMSVCTITFCSEPESFKAFTDSLIDFYQPGDPVVTGVSAKSGPASGGTKVVITGQNLSDAVQVAFGKTIAEASSAPQVLTNGSSTEIDALAPPGKAGSKVHIVVTTVEALAGGHPSAKTSAATFTYTASVPAPPLDVKGKSHATSITVTWKAPLSNGGHAITRYRVSAVAFKESRKKNAKKPPTVVALTKNASGRSAKLSGLRGGWGYTIKVQAVNRLGRGLPGVSEQFFFIRDPA